MENTQNLTASSPSLSDKSKQHTPAYASFDSNTDKVFHVLQFILHGIRGFSDELKDKLEPKVMSIVTEIAQIPQPQDTEAIQSRDVKVDDRVQKISDTLVEPFKQFTGGLLTVREWIPVLLVTTVEAYLQDVLTYAARVDPSIMESQAKVPYAKVVKAQSLEHLKEELKEKLPPQWARNFLDEGGPKRWIKKLTRMGARGFRPEAAKEMETLWGVRHLLVHSSGIATAEFVRRYPEIGAKIGESILIRSYQLTAWITVVYHFAEVTDFYFVRRAGAAEKRVVEQGT